MTLNWLDRRIGRAGPFLTLCLSEAEFRAALDHLQAQTYPQWLTSDATTHRLWSPKGELACIVCLSKHEGRNPIEVAGLLVHEAVHVWQEWCIDIGESSPAVEQEAYAIQAIAQELMAEFARRQQP